VSPVLTSGGWHGREEGTHLWKKGEGWKKLPEASTFLPIQTSELCAELQPTHFSSFWEAVKSLGCEAIDLE
jgi:hypothetical protein